jgi:hypothetical protein
MYCDRCGAEIKGETADVSITFFDDVGDKNIGKSIDLDLCGPCALIVKNAAAAPKEGGSA